MKNTTQLLIMLLVVSLLANFRLYNKTQSQNALITVQRNELKKQREPIQTINDIQTRYLKVHGTPTKQWQQCEFDFIFYNDKSECIE